MKNGYLIHSSHHSEMNESGLILWSLLHTLTAYPGNIPTHKNHMGFLLYGMKTLMIGKAK